MNDIYAFGGGVYGFQRVMDPVLEAELRKCKTQKERDDVVAANQATIIICAIVCASLGALLCGVIALFMH